MEGYIDIMIKDRQQAGELLSRRLKAYQNNAVVVGIPHGGVCVASAIAENLALPLEIMPCRKIKHPADKTKNIGSVSYTEACIHDCPFDVPQDYIYHQMALLRHAISHQQRIYYEDFEAIKLQYKTVILVDDILRSSDTMLACLREIRKQNPLNVIVAVPVVNTEAARLIREEADDLVFLRMENTKDTLHHYYADFPVISDEEVREIFQKSKKKNTRLQPAFDL